MGERYETILTEKDRGITTITLNRPDKFNAQSPQLMKDIYSALMEAAEDETTKVIIITGAGRAFCAGGDVELDVSHIPKLSAFEWREYIAKFYRVPQKIYHMEKPVIAAINGVAAGGGCDLAMACDIRIASEKAKFGMAYIGMGIISDLGGIYFLPRLVGMGKAKLLSFTGDIIDAKYAEQIGLVDQVVPENELKPVVDELARKLANGPSLAIGMYKHTMHKSANMDLDTSLKFVNHLQYLLLNTEDFKEGFKAFLEKRKPVFKGK